MTQTAAYRPTPITQRDGSPLANSNCRMASIATGLDYETLGQETSSGATMRTYTDDQSGGTDSGDAVQAWQRGYGETLWVGDGYTFDDVMAALAEGRLVHLDVWHAAMGAVCLSGSGLYGHTVAVLPDQDANGWLVSDPWCNPPKWARVSTARLRDGAEEWGRRVYGAATGGRDVGAVVRELMAHSFPGHERSIERPETSGPQRVLFTVTRAHDAGAHDMAISTRGLTLTSRHAVNLPEGTRVLEYPDANAPEVGRFSGHVDYYGTPAAGWKAVRVDPGDGSRIAYTSTAATAWEKDPEPPADDLAARQAQYDADATAILGPRPSG